MLISLTKLDHKMSLLIKNIFSSFFLRFLNLAITTLIVPLTVGLLSVDDYAFFAVLISASFIFAYADLGLGLSIVNSFANYKRNLPTFKQQVLVTNLYVILTLISMFVLIIGSGVLFLFFSELIPKLFFSWQVLLVCVAIGIPTGVIQRLLFANQRTYEANIWYALGRILALCCIYLCGKFEMSLPYFVLAMIGSPVLINIISTLYYFSKNNKLIPNLRIFNPKYLPSQMSQGIAFLILNLAVMVDTGIDVILLSHFESPDFIRQYDLLVKIYLYVPAIISVACFPIWPSLRAALDQGDVPWVLKVAKNATFLILIVSTSTSIFLFVFQKQIIELWTGVTLHITHNVALFMSIYAVLTSIFTLQAMILNSFKEVGYQAKVALIFIPLVIIVKVLSLYFYNVETMLGLFCLIYLLKMFVVQHKLSNILKVNSAQVNNVN